MADEPRFSGCRGSFLAGLQPAKMVAGGLTDYAHNFFSSSLHSYLLVLPSSVFPERGLNLCYCYMVCE